MRGLLGLLLATALPLSAHAQATPPAPPAQPTGSFIFAIGSETKSVGCVALVSASVVETFPKLANGTVAAIRFYYAQGDGSAVTQNSQYFTSTLVTDAAGNMGLSPERFCGLTAGHYSFKDGLVDTAGTLLEFMPDSDFKTSDNSLDIPKR